MNLFHSTAAARVRTRTNAFTLIGVLVGAAIFAAAFTGLFLTYGQAVRMLERLREFSRAEDVVMSNMEFLRTRTWDQLTNSSAGFSTSSSNLTESVSATSSNSPVCSHLVLLSNDPLRFGIKNATRDITLSNVSSDPGNMMQATVAVSWDLSNGTRWTNSMATYITRGGLSGFLLGSGSFAPVVVPPGTPPSNDGTIDHENEDNGQSEHEDRSQGRFKDH